MQVSLVHGLLSLQLRAEPGWQLPPLQWSPTVHLLPSLHEAELFAFTQPTAGLQESVVQMLLSLQFGGLLPTQLPLMHLSTVVHLSLSSQGLLLLVCTQPLPVSHVSMVQMLLLLQFGGAPPTHWPPTHLSFVVHALPSLQAIVLLAFLHPVAGTHESVVHRLLSLQSGAGPPAHEPPLHLSLVVHALPSSHGWTLLACTQPLTTSHESLVHRLPSSQFGGGPPTQLPLPHLSFVVQALLSSQAMVLFTCTQPVAGSHESFVHGFPSSQPSAGPPAQLPLLHLSLVVHALPSLQASVLFSWKQPVSP